MAIDFYTALRSRARSEERQARLTGRPLTQAETAAPYVALADMAGERLRAAKSIELAERGQVTQERQFGETLEEQRLARAEASRFEEERARLERERLAEAKRAEEARIRMDESRLEEQKRTTDIQAQMAKEANEPPGIGQSLLQAGIGGGIGAYMAAGTALGGPLGAVGGAIIAFAASRGCIIISACTNPDSYEVDLARNFRDRFMGPETLTGYYALAAILAPMIDKYKAVRWFVYRMLVKRLVDYGEWVFGHKSKTARPLSKIISKTFLELCGKIGRRII